MAAETVTPALATSTGVRVPRLDVEVRHFLFDASCLVPLKTTEAPHYRRVVTERVSGRSGPGPGCARYASLMARLRRALRDPERLRGRCGRCGRCPYRAVCGGSRARAYATSGDHLAEDPACS
jgi:hypothetical protein